jgi:undecaprenyl diphosphate synthase
MDGNGRWARSRGLAHSAGHRQGARAARRAVEAAPELGISVLTLFAFSSDNWQRPPSEVGSLMFLLEKYLREERQHLVENEVRLNVIGRRDRLQAAIADAINQTETATAAGSSLLLRLAVDYSARQAIAAASQLPPLPGTDPAEDFCHRLDRVTHSAVNTAAVDLVVRTGGEQRLSDFLLWESAYAELCFQPVLWPDFDRRHLAAAVKDFRRRDRRFGQRPAVISQLSGLDTNRMNTLEQPTERTLR